MEIVGWIYSNDLFFFNCLEAELGSWHLMVRSGLKHIAVNVPLTKRRDGFFEYFAWNTNIPLSYMTVNVSQEFFWMLEGNWWPDFRVREREG